MRGLKRALLKTVVSSLLFVAGVSYIPYLWCSRFAENWYADDPVLIEKLGRGVETRISSSLDRMQFHTGSEQFNGEWLFGTYTMAAMGYGQTALCHPELRARHIELMELCLLRLKSARVRAFDVEMWSSDAIDDLDNDRDAHAAYLGYFNLALSLHRLLRADSDYAELNDRITEALVRRVEHSRLMLIESYPFEVYPVDNCAVVGSIGLHARATGIDRSAFVSNWVANCRSKYVDAESGLLIQAVDSAAGLPLDDPRASGTSLGAYMIAFADHEFSRELYEAMRREVARSVFGFGGVKEYPSCVPAGRGDIDSGPIVMGFGLSPTGFMISGTRLHRDPAFFGRLVATAHAWGAPCEREGQLNFVTGGSLGDAIMFAMLTAPKGGVGEP